MLWWSGNKCCVRCLEKRKDTTDTNSGNDENPKCTARGGTCADKNKDKYSGNGKEVWYEVAVLLFVVLGQYQEGDVDTNGGNDENQNVQQKGGTCADKNKDKCSGNWKKKVCVEVARSTVCCITGTVSKEGDTTDTNGGNDENQNVQQGGTCADKGKDKCSGNWKRGLCKRGGRSTVCCIGTVTKEGSSDGDSKQTCSGNV